MKIHQLKIGTKVTNQYGERLTVAEVVGNMVRTHQDYNNMYHHTKLFCDGKEIKI